MVWICIGLFVSSSNFEILLMLQNEEKSVFLHALRISHSCLSNSQQCLPLSCPNIFSIAIFFKNSFPCLCQAIFRIRLFSVIVFLEQFGEITAQFNSIQFTIISNKTFPQYISTVCTFQENVLKDFVNCHCMALSCLTFIHKYSSKDLIIFV